MTRGMQGEGQLAAASTAPLHPRKGGPGEGLQTPLPLQVHGQAGLGIYGLTQQILRARDQRRKQVPWGVQDSYRTSLPRPRDPWTAQHHTLKAGRSSEFSLSEWLGPLPLPPSGFGFPGHLSAPHPYRHWVALLDDPGISGAKQASQDWAGSVEG